MARLLLPIVGLAYPFLVYFGLLALGARQIALLLLACLGLRLVLVSRDRWRAGLRASWLPIAAVASISLATAASGEPRLLMLAPALANAALLASFALSLPGESTVERLARLQAPDLSPEEVRYCGQVTRVWCAFFALNGGISLWLGLRGSPAAWAIYTGLVSYLLVAALFAAELCVRHWRFRRYLGGFADPLFRRIFPPPAPAPPAAPETRAAARSRLQPEVLAVQRKEAVVEIEMRVPEDLACWPGHFPRYRILPGVLQLQWALEEIARWTGAAPELTRVDALKFKTPLLPGQRTRLRIRRDLDAPRFHFEFAHEGVVYSQGRIVLAAEAPR